MRGSGGVSAAGDQHHVRVLRFPLVDSKAAMGHIDRVAPFRIQRSVAEQKLKEHLAGHFWAPNEIKGDSSGASPASDVGSLWAYTGVARSSYKGKVGIWWYKTVTWIAKERRARGRSVRPSGLLTRGPPSDRSRGIWPVPRSDFRRTNPIN